MQRVKMNNIKTLVLIRHGESTRNVAESGFCYKNNRDREAVGVLQDRLYPLTNLGEKQAIAAGRGLKSFFGSPSCIIHSGFVRAKQTAGKILNVYESAGNYSLPFIENPLVRERNAGYLGNMTHDEVLEYAPWAHAAWLTGDPFTIIPLGGESLASMCEGRLLLFLRQLDEDFLGKSDPTVFVVSHGRAILCLRYLLEGWSHDRMNSAVKNENPPNCSATTYDFSRMGNPELRFANRIF